MSLLPAETEGLEESYLSVLDPGSAKYVLRSVASILIGGAGKHRGVEPLIESPVAPVSRRRFYHHSGRSVAKWFFPNRAHSVQPVIVCEKLKFGRPDVSSNSESLMLTLTE